MDFETILQDKSRKPKDKIEWLCNWLMGNPDQLQVLMAFAQDVKGPAKATCIEAIEFATKKDPGIATDLCLAFVTANLAAKAPRVKRESAKVIANIAHRFPGKLDEAVNGLLDNSEHEGTVVRWSAAFALSEILKMKTALNKTLIPAIEAICRREEKNSIRKMYTHALNVCKA